MPIKYRDPKAATPVIAQFLTIKAEHQEHLLFFRMGDFYELFFEDAERAAPALGIALTKRGKYVDEDIAMCGVPYHQLSRYLHEAVNKGLSVAIAEQMEDPKEAKKRGSKAVVQREVRRIVTAGTLSESELLSEKHNNFLTAFAETKTAAALAWADISTGAAAVITASRADLPSLFARLSPSEVLASTPIDAELAAIIDEAGAKISELHQGAFDVKQASERAAQAFGASSLDAFGAFERIEAAALAALTDYLKITQIDSIPLLKPPYRETPEGAMRIDAATRRNLELTSGPEGKREGSLLATIDRTLTSAGARMLAGRLSAPLLSASAISDRLDAVQAFFDSPNLREDIRAALRRTPDIERALSRLSVGRGGPRDLANLRDGLRAAEAVRERLSNENPPAAIEKSCAALAGHDALREELANNLVEDPPARLSDGGVIVPGALEALDEACALRDDARQIVGRMQSVLQEETGVNALKVKHNNVLGYFIETPSAHMPLMLSEAHEGVFIHRQSTASAARFTTVELSELEEKIGQAAQEAAELERAAFMRLTQAVIAQTNQLRGAAEALAALDVAAGLAELAVDLNWTRPALSEDTVFRITGGRHPVVEAALRKAGDAPFIANDCDLSANLTDTPTSAHPVWLLTGPNMAGKSTFLRQNALIAVLAQIGAYVPAESAEIGLVDQLFSRVGASDDLARGRSTFMVEMVETAAILNQAGPRALVILDEIGRGTATYDGLSIAWATLEHLDDRNRCRTLFATHYHELTALSSKRERIKNATMRVSDWNGEMRFLREVVAGAAEKSYGVQVAKLAGLPKVVVHRAEAILEMLETGGESAETRAHKLIEDLPLFSAAEEAPEPTSEVEEKLRELNPDTMTPRDALDALYELRALLAD